MSAWCFRKSTFDRSRVRLDYIDLYNASSTAAGTPPPGTPSGWRGCYSDAAAVKIEDALYRSMLNPPPQRS
jgi:hypothetical protein